jgi:glycine hydroxymethyltransferase
VDLRAKSPDITGADAEAWLGKAAIVCNKNGIPDDPRPPKLTSGVRLGTPAVTTRGLGTAEMDALAGWIDRVLTAKGDEAAIAGVRREVIAMCERFPMPGAGVAAGAPAGARRA